MTSLYHFIRELPKTETHLHIEGALPWELLQALYPEKYAQPPESWEESFRFRDFAHFEGELLSYAGDYFNSAERYHACAKAVFEDRLKRNVRYVECSFASGCIDFFGLDGREVIDAIADAVPVGLEVRIFLGIHHAGYTDKMKPVLEDALKWEPLAGIDLHGPEDAPLGAWAEGYWARARDNGKFTKAHAGEFCGAEFVRYAIEKLGAQRIEHGERTIEDPDLVALLADRGIALDMCPISNIKLGVAKCHRTHSIRKLFDAGVKCTLSTDDPISFGNVIEDEYALIAEEDHFSRKDLAILARNGFEIALADEAWKKPFIDEINKQVAGCG